MKRTLKGLLVIMVSLALTMFLAACSQETGEGGARGKSPSNRTQRERSRGAGNGQGKGDHRRDRGRNGACFSFGQA